MKLLVSAILLGYCMHLMDPTTLRGISVKWGWLVGSLVFVFVDYVIGAARFKILLDPIARISLFHHIKFYFWAGLFNSALPTSIGGDAMRVLWLKEHDVSVNKATLFVLTERLIGVFILVLIAGTAAINYGLPPTIKDYFWESFEFVFSGALVGLALVYWFRGTEFVARLTRLAQRVRGALSLPQGLALFGLTFLYQGVTIVITIGIAVSIGIYLDWYVWFLIVPLLWLLTVLPISVGGLGVREVGLVFFLREYGQSNEKAVALGLMVFLVYLAAGVVGGAWYSVDSGIARRKSKDDPKVAKK